MTKWKIIRINNTSSKYDFRLIPNINNNFSDVNFFKHSFFRILVSLSSYLTDGIISDKSIIDSSIVNSNSLYRVIFNNKTPSIFSFTIDKYNGKSSKYLTIDDKMTKLIFHDDTRVYNINLLQLPDTKIFSSLFTYQSINNISNFLEVNKEAYTHVLNTSDNIYITTGYLRCKKINSLIIDLLVYDKKFFSSKTNVNTSLQRCKILDQNILESLNITHKYEGYCLFTINFTDKYNFKIKKIIPISFDEYLTYIYDLLLPYKYDFNDVNNSNLLKGIEYSDDNVERVAFAIDPDGSKDRDDAIAAFYLKDNNIIYNKEEASHIRLTVHISDTLSYIRPEDSNYYYHYSKFKSNTDYLDKFNLPMMDRILSENKLSLDGDNNDAITINLTYRIIDNENFIIKPFPEIVKVHRSKNLKIIGTTYKKFSESFGLDKDTNFDNDTFNKRFIINCNNKLPRDFNEFVYEGSSLYPNKVKKLIANNLKQLYIFFVNSLNHTGKDTLIKLPSNLSRQTHFDKSNIYLEFSPVDMWSHSLIEYTALESNIYFSYLMYFISKNRITYKNNSYTFDYKLIIDVNETVGKKNTKLLLDNILNDKVIKVSKCGIYRNLYTPSKTATMDNIDYYINDEIRRLLIKCATNETNYDTIINNFLVKYNYKIVENKSSIIQFLKLLMALRQLQILVDSKTKLEISYKLISKDLKMKAKYDTFPFSHLDICSLFYTHATSPMRRFIDINVHHFIFNPKSIDYIYRNIDITRINMAVNIGKYINQLVNSYRFIEFISINSNQNKLTMNVKVLDKKRNLIGIEELVNFIALNDIVGIKDGYHSFTIDEYNLPILKKSDSKVFNIFFHMLKKESPNIRKKCQLFLEKIFLVKIIKTICKT
jgi:hypothetical protein